MIRHSRNSRVVSYRIWKRGSNTRNIQIMLTEFLCIVLSKKDISRPSIPSKPVTNISEAIDCIPDASICRLKREIVIPQSCLELSAQHLKKKHIMSRFCANLKLKITLHGKPCTKFYSRQYNNTE